MPQNVVVLTSVPQQAGWTPILHMVRLASRLFEAPLLEMPTRFSSLRGLTSLMLGRRRTVGAPDALLVAPSAPGLRFLIMRPEWRREFHRVAAWIIDSFWVDRMPRLPLHRLFDQFFVCTKSDVAEHERKTRVPTSYLPWGSDVLELGSAAAERPIDVLRVGRQPESWSDDLDNFASCATRGIRYAGRPPFPEDPEQQQPFLMQQHMQRAKLVLASTNRVQQTTYTHPKKEYITGRWTDSISCGCVVAGVPPRTDPAFTDLLWPEACLDLGTKVRDDSLALIAEYLAGWTPAIAKYNYQMALRRLDWRWRLRTIADWLGRPFCRLEDDLARLQAIATECGSSAAPAS